MRTHGRKYVPDLVRRRRRQHAPSAVELFVCENGLIALNPPLTPRRIGSHSTRTAHPHFLANVQDILSASGLPIIIANPFGHWSAPAEFQF
jgi:hypothetical protein